MAPQSTMQQSSVYSAQSAGVTTVGFGSSSMHTHHDDESSSLYNMYGFKQSEGNIQDVFKFISASKSMPISENRKYSIVTISFY